MDALFREFVGDLGLFTGLGIGAGLVLGMLSRRKRFIRYTGLASGIAGGYCL